MKSLNLPLLGDAIPKQGNLFSRAFGKMILFLTGWKFEGAPPNLAKFVIIAAPHTSNWDAFYGLSAVLALGLDARWMAKHTLFKGAFGKFLQWLGGVPIRRDASYGVVHKVGSLFKEKERFVLAITPEGTRKKVKNWKTGFYYIALEAKVPIAMGFLDYSRRVLGFGPGLFPSGDLRADFEKFQIFYSKIVARRPEKFNPVLLSQENFKVKEHKQTDVKNT